MLSQLVGGSIWVGCCCSKVIAALLADGPAARDEHTTGRALTLSDVRATVSPGCDVHDDEHDEAVRDQTVDPEDESVRRRFSNGDNDADREPDASRPHDWRSAHSPAVSAAVSKTARTPLEFPANVTHDRLASRARHVSRRPARDACAATDAGLGDDIQCVATHSRGRAPPWV